MILSASGVALEVFAGFVLVDFGGLGLMILIDFGWFYSVLLVFEWFWWILLDFHEFWLTLGHFGWSNLVVFL